MIELKFECTFETDIVLHASSNTEGKIDTLFYIPGSNFLGIAANSYDKTTNQRGYESFGNDAFMVFHSGKVRFGDGHIVIDNMPTYQVPFSYQAPKEIKNLRNAIMKNKLVVHHFHDYSSSNKDEIQLQQLRKGFFNEDGTVDRLTHNYSQKSAYNKYTRRSKDRTMFGYFALPKDSKWEFSLKLDDSMKHHAETIKSLLIGNKRLAKSKSAQYGKVSIVFKELLKEDVQGLENIQIQKDGYLYLYAHSRLALTNENGVNTYVPTPTSLGFESDTNVAIDWHKSQIRTSRYTPYVGVRKNFDPERLIVEKGSVFAIKIKNDSVDLQLFQKNIEKGIGLYLSEGHGEILVNPTWLLEGGYTFAKHNNVTLLQNELKNDERVNQEAYDNPSNNWLTQQREKEEKEKSLFVSVMAYIKENPNKFKNKKAQWGQIRSLCRQSKDSESLYTLLFEEKGNQGFLRHGRGLEKWRNSNLIEELDRKKEELGDDYKKFMTLLSIYAPKQDNRAKGRENE